MIRIRSKAEGFRRCGIAHPAAWTEYPNDQFTSEQLEILKAEPMLQVLTGEAAESASTDLAGSYTNKKLMAILDRMGVEIPRGAKKADLEALIDAALDAPVPARSADFARPEDGAGPDPARPVDDAGPTPTENGQEE